jgi:hypothetical protein
VSLLPITRIAVFFDGTFFNKASNYYNHQHERRSRLSIWGVHELIRHRFAQHLTQDVGDCRIVESHYFRGRISANEAKERPDWMLSDRIVDDVLMREGVTTHYLPMQHGHEKGIDVWLAMEAFDCAVQQRCDVLALVAGDSDYVPLLRKLQSRHTRVMQMGFDYSFEWEGATHMSKTSSRLSAEARYPLLLSDLINDPAHRDDPLVNALFVTKGESRPLPDDAHAAEPAADSAPQEAHAAQAPASAEPVVLAEGRLMGEVMSLFDSHGFIRLADGQTLFFHRSELAAPLQFWQIKTGDKLHFVQSPSPVKPGTFVATDVHAA